MPLHAWQMKSRGDLVSWQMKSSVVNFTRAGRSVTEAWKLSIKLLSNTSTSPAMVLIVRTLFMSGPHNTRGHSFQPSFSR